MRRVRLGINVKVWWLILSVVGLVSILSPCHVLAQEEKVDLILRLASGGYSDEVEPGEDNIFFLEIMNNADKTITNIQLSSDGPEGWVVEFRPERIDSISAGNYRTVDINIKPAENINKGRYTVTIIADSAETRRVMRLFVRVEKGTSVWLWVGVVVTAVVIAGFVIVFMRFNRQ